MRFRGPIIPGAQRTLLCFTRPCGAAGFRALGIAGRTPAMLDVSFAAALFGGLISFLSPCVLPLVPPYLSFLAGITLDELQARDDWGVRRRAVLTAVLFVAGFSTVFVLLGATASAFGNLVRQHLTLLSTVAGVAIIVMGLHFIGVFRIGLLYREARVTVGRSVDVWGAYLMGLAFAFGWTPCIGPVLAAILAVARSETSVARGALLLAVYSAGLGIPFILAALAMGPFVALLKRMRSRFAYVERTMGVLLVLTGVAFLGGWIQTASFWLLELVPGLGRLG
jgi:cytochrome c-type biogenesis protein